MSGIIESQRGCYVNSNEYEKLMAENERLKESALAFLRKWSFDDLVRRKSLDEFDTLKALAGGEGGE